MITTTVVWPQLAGTQNPTEGETAAQVDFVNQIAPGWPADETTITGQYIDNNLEVTRQWPDQETAQQWVDYLLANFNVSSAVINTD